MIRTLNENVFVAGRASASLVEVVDSDGDRTVDFEVTCEDAECDRYMCTHLTEDEARQEVTEHAAQHCSYCGRLRESCSNSGACGHWADASPDDPRSV